MAAAVFCVLAAACGGHSGVTGPTSNPPQITCPVDLTVSGVAASSQAVTYAAATVSGGAPPGQTTCTPASGQSFPLGSTTVTCTATDASSRSASCSFNVTLKGYSIAVTRYGAYGDSITEGENGLSVEYSPFVLDTPNAYPTKLQQAFDAQYPDQGIVVINRGISGERVEVTAERMRTLLPQDKPQAVLILGGYNNLTGPCAFGTSDPSCGQAILDVRLGVRDCIRRVKEAGLNINPRYVFVSTLTPPGPYLGGVHDRRIRGDAIESANNGIRQYVAAEGATLVDTYPLFLGHEADYIEADGLHLRPAGNQALADSFFRVITSTVPQTPLFVGNSPLR